MVFALDPFGLNIFYFNFVRYKTQNRASDQVPHCLLIACMSSFANSADPDEMQHNAAFHQGLQSLLR